MKKTGLFPAMAFSAMALFGCDDNDDAAVESEKKSQPNQEMMQPKDNDCARGDNNSQDCERQRKERKPGIRDRYRQTSASQIADTDYDGYDVS